MSYLEKDIREKLAKNLEFLEENLVLVEEEYYLKNHFGSRGFIDILAIDSIGNYVIIEIKRSNQAARQALHEISKYSMLLKQQIGVKSSQIRIMVVSTEWKELLTPYSEFKRTCMYELIGYEIKVSNFGTPISKKEILPLDPPPNVTTSRNHFIFLFRNSKDALSEIDNVCCSLKKNGLPDYLVSILKQNKQIMYPYSIYVSFQRYTVDYYIETLKNLINKYEDFNDVDELIDDLFYYGDQMSEEEYIIFLENKILIYVIRHVKSDSAEISYPEKASQGIGDSKVLKISRGGRYERDQRFSKEKFLLKEITGFSENNYQYYIGESNYRSKAQLEEVMEKVNEFLLMNKCWRRQILSAINNHKDSKYNLFISIYNPQNIFESIYKFIKEDDSMHLPHYLMYIVEENNSTIYLYKGVITWNGLNTSFNNMFKKHFPGGVLSYFIERFNEENYYNIIDDLGFTFETEVIILEEEEEEYFSYVLNEFDYNLQSIQKKFYIMDFLSENTQFSEDIIKFYDKYTVQL